MSSSTYNSASALAPLGRDLEIQQLSVWLDEANETSRSKMLVVSGEEGLGSRFVAQAASRRLAARSPSWRVVAATADPSRSWASRGVITALLRAAGDLPEDAPVTSARSGVEALVESAGIPETQAETTTQFLGELLDIPVRAGTQLSAARHNPRVMSDRIQLALGTLFGGWAEQSPVLVRVDHLHYADPASLSLFQFLLRSLQELPLVFLVSCDPELAASLTSERGPASAGIPVEHIELEPIADHYIETLVRGARGRDEPSIVQRAAGNPLLALELCRLVNAGGDPDALPGSIENAARARIRLLDTEERATLRRAAVVGYRFAYIALSALGEGSPLRALRALERRDIIGTSTMPARFVGTREQQFLHPALYRAALMTARAARSGTLHSIAARWLGSRNNVPISDIAYHHRASGEAKRALACWTAATARADQSGDPHGVLEYVRRAFAVASGHEAVELPLMDEFGLRVREAEALHQLDRNEELDEKLRELDAFMETSDFDLVQIHTPELGDANPSQERVTPIGFETSDSGRHARPMTSPMIRAPSMSGVVRQHAELLRVDPSEMLVRISLIRGDRLRMRGEFDAAMDLLADAIVIADSLAGSELQIRTRDAIVSILGQAGRHAMASMYAEDIAKRFDTSRHPLARGVVHATRALAPSLRGEVGEDVLGDFLVATEAFDEAGYVREAMSAQLNAGSALHALGDRTAACAALRSAYDRAHALDMSRQEAWAATNLAMALGDSVPLDEALDMLRQARNIAESASDRRLVVACDIHEALLCLLHAAPDGALAAARRAVSAADACGEDVAQLARVALVSALVGADRHIEALGVAKKLRESIGGATDALGELRVEFLVAVSIAREACGRPPEGVAQPIEQALEVLEQRLENIDTARLRETFINGVPAHASALRRARSLGLDLPEPVLSLAILD